MKWQSAIFDLDGTIIDSQQYWHIEKGKYVERYGVEAPDTLADELDNYELEGTARLLIDRYLPDVPAQKIIGDIVEIMHRHYLSDVALKPGIEEVFRRLHESGTKICLGTASRRAMFCDVLQRLDVWRWFDFAANTELVARDKHDPDVFLYAAGMAGAEVGRCVVFDDALYAVRAAKTAGFMTAGVEDAFSLGSPEEMKAACDFYIPDYAHIPESFWV